MRGLSSWIVVVLAVGISVVAGGSRAVEQHRALTAYERVPARQTGGFAHGAAGSASASDATAEPSAFTYEYTFKGNTYESNRLTPLPGLIAEDVLRAELNNVGGVRRAYVDPDDPAKSFAVVHVAFWPYALMLLGMAVVGFAVRAMIRVGCFSSVAHIERHARSGWYQVMLGRGYGPSVMTAGIALFAWYLAGGVIVSHYILLCSELEVPIIKPAVLMMAGPYMFVGLGPVYEIWRVMRSTGMIATPRVLINQQQPRLDRCLDAVVQVPVARVTSLREVSASLQCIERRGLTSRRRFISTRVVSRNCCIDSQHPASRRVGFDIPRTKRRASSFCSRWKYPRIEWQLCVTVVNARGRACRYIFPIEMHTAANTHSPVNQKGSAPATMAAV